MARRQTEDARIVSPTRPDYARVRTRELDSYAPPPPNVVRMDALSLWDRVIAVTEVGCAYHADPDTWTWEDIERVRDAQRVADHAARRTWWRWLHPKPLMGRVDRAKARDHGRIAAVGRIFWKWSCERVGRVYGVSTSWEIACRGMTPLVHVDAERWPGIAARARQVRDNLALVHPEHPAVRDLARLVGPPTRTGMRRAPRRMGYTAGEAAELREFFSRGG